MDIIRAPAEEEEPVAKIAKVEPTASPSAPTSNPDQTRCDYYVQRKRRFCRTERRDGSRFCHTHDNESSTKRDSSDPASGSAASGEVRVPCPINPNHTVYASRLEKHVKVCPDLRFVTTTLPYFRNDMHANRGEALAAAVGGGDDDASGISGGTRMTHKDLSSEELDVLQKKVADFYLSHVKPNITVLDTTDQLEELLTTGSSSEEGQQLKSRKHAPQHRALLSCLSGALEKCITGDQSVAGFLELGAGKGGLAVALQEVLVMYTMSREGSDAAAAAVVREQLATALPFLRRVAPQPVLGVVDFDGFRRKGDARVAHSLIPLKRLRINLKDLDLASALASEFPATACTSTGEHWAVLGKHLCGACTDFALSCITEPSLMSSAAPSGASIDAVVLATCCHHRCELRHMNPLSGGASATNTGLSIPDGDFAVTPREYAAMTSMSSWGVSGSVVSEERRTMGYYCKRVIDWVRVLYLREKGYPSAHLCQYTSSDVTDENVCIVASLQRSTEA